MRQVPEWKASRTHEAPLTGRVQKNKLKPTHKVALGYDTVHTRDNKHRDATGSDTESLVGLHQLCGPGRPSKEVTSGKSPAMSLADCEHSTCKGAGVGQCLGH